jgi:endoglucanase
MKILRVTGPLLLVASSTILGCADEFSPDPIGASRDADAGAPIEADIAQNTDDGGVPSNAEGGALLDVGAVGPVGPPMMGLHVVANQILNAQGLPVVLHGVNRSGTEYKCVNGSGIFDGPSNEASVQAIASWKANAVRIPLNESCWLAINGAPSAFSGDNYKNAIKSYVALLHTYNIVPILELHWVGPGASLATSPQQQMPDEDHAPAFWTDLTTAFAADDGVIFEPFNEPFPNNNTDNMPAWQCWREGCMMVPHAVPREAAALPTYLAAGMQELVNAIRQAETGVTHVILLDGVEFSNDVSQWLQYEPIDPAPIPNLGASWHVYNNNRCSTIDLYLQEVAPVIAAVPLIATEIGENDCKDAFISPLMSWLDSNMSGYLAWSWDAYAACQLIANPWSLITDYTTGTPNSPYAQTFHDHIAAF